MPCMTTATRRMTFAYSVGHLVVCATVAQAHHSISTVYDEAKQVTIEGVVSKFQFVNPHPLVVVDVKTPAGAQQWMLEMDNKSELVDIGFDDATLKPGDQVVVAGNPSRTEQRSLYIRRLDRAADGFSFLQIADSPSIASPARSRN